jgi:hypothetical protein
MTRTDTTVNPDPIIADTGPEWPITWRAHRLDDHEHDPESGEVSRPGWYVSAFFDDDDDVLVTMQLHHAVTPHGREDGEGVAKRLAALLNSGILATAEQAAAVIERELNSDASESAPITVWTDDEVDTAVRAVLAAGDQLMEAVDAATEHHQ